MGVKRHIKCCSAMITEYSHHTVYRCWLGKRKCSLGGHYKAGLHLLLSNNIGIKGKDAICSKCSQNCLLCECFFKGLAKNLNKISLLHLVLVKLFKQHNLNLPSLLHPCGTNNIKSLECMCAMWWITKDDNVVGKCEIQKLSLMMSLYKTIRPVLANWYIV